MKKPSLFAFALAALLLGNFAVPLAARADDAALVVGTAGKETDAEVYYAQDMGFFFAPGAIYSSTSPTTALAVSVNGPVRTAKDLTGKILAGVSLGGLDQLSLEAWVDKNGGDSASAKYVEVQPSLMVAALERGTIAAASLPDPALGAAVAAGTVRVIGNNYDSIAKTFMITGWFATGDWLAKNPDVAKKFAAAMAETADWANANHDRAAEILFKYTKIDTRKSHVRFANRLSAAIVQPVLDAGAQYKMLDKSVTLGDLISTR